MVRLKDCPENSRYTEGCSFNSKMVRLKALEEAVLGAIMLFQFQNGAIKSREMRHRTGDLIPFQFQNGAIKRKRHFHIFTQFICFNSKMVRLKANARLF